MLRKIALLAFVTVSVISTAAAERAVVGPTNANRFLKPASNSEIVCYQKSRTRILVGSVKNLKFNGSATLIQSRRAAQKSIAAIVRKLRSASGKRKRTLEAQLILANRTLNAINFCRTAFSPTPGSSSSQSSVETGVGELEVCADLNHDGTITRSDFDLFLRAYFRFAGAAPLADVTGDGSIDVTDYRAFISSWNANDLAACSAHSSSSAQPPQPPSLSSSSSVSSVVSSGTSSSAGTIHACNDGLDNDGDGLTDWQLDLGCAGPDDDSEVAAARDQKSGWTTYNKSSDTQIVYVSNSIGNDTWSGLCPEAPLNGICGPKRSIAQGFRVLRPNSADWLLLRRGDSWREDGLTRFPQYGTTWTGENLAGGRSDSERIVIASYGESKSRPRLELSQYQSLWNVTNAAIHDLEIYTYKKDVTNSEFTGTSQSGIFLLYTNRNILIENCHLRFGSFIVQSVDDVNGPHRFDNIELRRNIVENAYSVSSHSQGIYTASLHPAHLLLEDNVFDHNGWSEDFRLVLHAPNSNLTQWQTVTDGRVGFTIDQHIVNLSGLNFSSATSMTDVAAVIESAINAQLGPTNTVRFRWSTGGHVFFLQTDHFASNTYYQIQAYAGAVGGTDLHDTGWLNSGSQGAPEATVFNRNMYLSQGYGATIVRGNIDANGASGGVQLRMGGSVTDNLFLKSPLALTYGHAENPGNSIVTGEIKRNVILGARDISDAPRGFGIALGSTASTSGGLGPSLIENVEISNNIVAHNELGTSNILGISVGGTGPVTNVNVHDNIVYDWARPVWPNPNDNRACALSLTLAVGSSAVSVRDNSFQQPLRGFATCSSVAPTNAVLSGNYYYSTSPDSAALWSTGWFQIGSAVTSAQWISRTGDTDTHLQAVPYSDPNRGVESYMQSLGLTASYDAFMREAKRQSRFEWHPQFTAAAVNAYVRAGFEREH